MRPTRVYTFSLRRLPLLRWDMDDDDPDKPEIVIPRKNTITLVGCPCGFIASAVTAAAALECFMEHTRYESNKSVVPE